MEKYIKLNSGNLYSYNEKGITIHFENDKKWKPSSLSCEAILYSDRTDYQELDQIDVVSQYGLDVVESAKECFKKIDDLLFKKGR